MSNAKMLRGQFIWYLSVTQLNYMYGAIFCSVAVAKRLFSTIHLSASCKMFFGAPSCFSMIFKFFFTSLIKPQGKAFEKLN